jgi:hypothetical protein
MKNCNSKSNRNTFGVVIVLGGFALAAGCGDAGASDGMLDTKSVCEAMCAHGDACPNLYAEADCVSECELAREQAAALGETCAYALEDFVECYGTLSCEELEARTLNRNSVDACTSEERAAVQCEPWQNDEVSEPVEPDMDEIRLACETFCDALAGCSLETEADCETVCVMGYAPYQAHSPACAETFVDAFSCYSNMTCSELVNRVNETGRIDSCTAIDDRTINICAQ